MSNATDTPHPPPRPNHGIHLCYEFCYDAGSMERSRYFGFCEWAEPPCCMVSVHRRRIVIAMTLAAWSAAATLIVFADAEAGSTFAQCTAPV